MKISIIVPAYNEEKLLPETLRHINAAAGVFGHCGMSSQLIVCDNNSSDQTANVARAAGAQVVFEPINQIGRARNKGAEAAIGEWLLFIDADSCPSPELFGEAAAAIKSGKVLAGGSTLRLDDSDWLANGVTRLWNLISRSFRSLAGSFIFCETAAFRQIGGFNLELFASEELDLARRLKKLASSRRQKIVILHRYPLRTSARKLKLYSRSDYSRFLLRTVAGMGSTLRSSKECHMWYDGRR